METSCRIVIESMIVDCDVIIVVGEEIESMIVVGEVIESMIVVSEEIKSMIVVSDVIESMIVVGEVIESTIVVGEVMECLASFLNSTANLKLINLGLLRFDRPSAHFPRVYINPSMCLFHCTRRV